jgi:hypothetical protein
MAGIKALRKIQLGKEASTDHDAGVAATTIWRGMGTLEDLSEYTVPEEAIGLMVESDRLYCAKALAAITFEEVEATFEQLPHIFEAGIMLATPTTDTGTGSGYIYTYNWPTTSQPTIRYYTIEGGDDQQEEESPYFYVEEFSLKGEGGAAVMVSANWKGRQIAPSTFTGALSAPTVEDILFSKGKLYIDVDTDAFGTTQKTLTLLDFELNAKTGLMPVWTADGAIYYSFVKGVGPEVTLKLTFEHDTIGVAEKAAWRAKTMRGIQLKFEGTALTSAGAYTYRTLIINLAGKWEKFDKIGEKDGNDVLQGTLRGKYSSSRSTMGSIIVVSDQVSLP